MHKPTRFSMMRLISLLGLLSAIAMTILLNRHPVIPQIGNPLEDFIAIARVVTLYRFVHLGIIITTALQLIFFLLLSQQLTVPKKSADLLILSSLLVVLGHLAAIWYVYLPEATAVANLATVPTNPAILSQYDHFLRHQHVALTLYFGTTVTAMAIISTYLHRRTIIPGYWLTATVAGTVVTLGSLLLYGRTANLSILIMTFILAWLISISISLWPESSK